MYRPTSDTEPSFRLVFVSVVAAVWVEREGEEEAIVFYLFVFLVSDGKSLGHHLLRMTVGRWGEGKEGLVLKEVRQGKWI